MGSLGELPRVRGASIVRRLRSWPLDHSISQQPTTVTPAEELGQARATAAGPWPLHRGSRGGNRPSPTHLCTAFLEPRCSVLSTRRRGRDWLAEPTSGPQQMDPLLGPLPMGHKVPDWRVPLRTPSGGMQQIGASPSPHHPSSDSSDPVHTTIWTLPTPRPTGSRLAPRVLGEEQAISRVSLVVAQEPLRSAAQASAPQASVSPFLSSQTILPVCCIWPWGVQGSPAPLAAALWA